MTKLTPEQRVEKAKQVLYEEQDHFDNTHGLACALYEMVGRPANQDLALGKALEHLSRALMHHTATNKETHERLWAVIQRGEPLLCDADDDDPEIAALCGDDAEGNSPSA